MAQVYVPENPREREQLQQGTTNPELTRYPLRSHKLRRFGIIDLLVILALFAAVTFLITAASRWAAPLIARPVFLPPGSAVCGLPAIEGKTDGVLPRTSTVGLSHQTP